MPITGTGWGSIDKPKPKETSEKKKVVKRRYGNLLTKPVEEVKGAYNKTLTKAYPIGHTR